MGQWQTYPASGNNTLWFWAMRLRSALRLALWALLLFLRIILIWWVLDVIAVLLGGPFRSRNGTRPSDGLPDCHILFSF